MSKFQTLIPALQATAALDMEVNSILSGFERQNNKNNLNRRMRRLERRSRTR